MKLILLATLASLALGAIPLSRQSPEEDYSEEMDRQYPGFPPRSRQNPELDYSEEMDRAIGILTTGNFTLFGVDDAEVEKEEEEEEQEGEADRRYRGSRGYLRM